jgi:hypothetical protein
MIKQLIKVIVVGWIAKRFAKSQQRPTAVRRDA